MSGAPVDEPSRKLLAVGSYTDAYGPFRARGRGVALISLDPSEGHLRLEHELALRPNPAYLRPDRGAHGEVAIWAVAEARGAEAGIVKLDVTADGELQRVANGPAPGDLPCHLDLSPDGAWLAGCCYEGGQVFVRRRSAPLDAPPADCLRREGSGPHPVRQTMAHPHACRFSPDGHWLLVPDLGADEVACYPFDPATGRLGRAPRVWSAPPGSGPRLLLFAADGRFVLVVQELACTLTALRWTDGRLDPVSTVRATRAGVPNTTAGLRPHPGGRRFLVTNRGADTVGLVGFDPASGELRRLAEHPSGGAKPRDLDVSPCGRWLVVANQDGDSLVVLRIEESGLVDAGHRLEIASPSCVRFLP